MSRRGPVLWSAVFATGVAAAALAWPALAGTGDVRSPGGVGRLGPASTDSAPEMVTAVQRDLKINATQATSRLAKEAWATGAESRLRQRLGSQFAGAWLTADAEALMVGVTSDQAADVVRAAGGTPRRVSRSESTLRAAKSSLDRRRPSSSVVAGWYVRRDRAHPDGRVRRGGRLGRPVAVRRPGPGRDVRRFG